jgi:hypothetical protein
MRAKVVQIALVIGYLVVFTRVGLATTAPGTLGVTATVDSSMNLVFSTAATGITLGGSGTSAATMAFGNVQAFGGTVPTGVTRTVNAPTNCYGPSP